MRIKWAFYILLVLFSLNIIGCHIITEYLSKRSSRANTSYGRDEISCKAASAISASATLDGRITIAWDLSADEKVVGYRIYYGLSSQKYKDCVDIGSPTESSPGVVKYNLINLEKGKRYYIAVIAYGENNKKSVFSSEVTAFAK